MKPKYFANLSKLLKKTKEMKEIFLTDNQMQQAYDQLSYFHDAGIVKTTLELDAEWESGNVVEIDVEGFSQLEWSEMERDTGGYYLIDNNQSLELTGVRNYNPDLDIFEDAWINDAQYNELVNGFCNETSC